MEFELETLFLEMYPGISDLMDYMKSLGIVFLKLIFVGFRTIRQISKNIAKNSALETSRTLWWHSDPLARPPTITFAIVFFLANMHSC